MLKVYKEGLWYYPDINRFTDADGNIIHNIHLFLQPWVVEEWKKYCRINQAVYQRVKGLQGWIDLYHIENSVDRELLDYIHQHNSVFPQE